MYMHEILQERRDGESERETEREGGRERGGGRKGTLAETSEIYRQTRVCQTSKIAVIARRHGIEMNLNSKLRERAKKS
jgi:hypothetical protein